MSDPWSRALCRLLLALSLLGMAAAGAAEHTLMRYPTLHGGTIVFVAHDNLWSVPRTGGEARRLTADEGRDLMPRFSPDGRWIAFTGEYQGNTDVYVMPAMGGEARRLTFTSDIVPDAPMRWGPNNMVVSWTPDSRSILFLSRREAWNTWIAKLFSVPVGGGLPQAFPLDRGGFLSYSPDGRQIAYNRIFRNFRTWKRYQGGLAQDIDLYDLETHQLTPLTRWPGTETFPMWYGQTIYFLADHDEHQRANLWAYNSGTRQLRQVTHFTDYDIDFPSLGSSDSAEAGIVFQQGGHLFVMDLPNEQLHQLDVTVPDDGTRTGPHWVDAKETLREHDTAGNIDYDLSPNGQRAVFSARGEIFTVPAEHGNTRNLTSSSQADEDHPAWSPDGHSIAYTTDAGGEQQIAVRPAEGGPERILTHFTRGYFYGPRWSPGGDRIAFSDNEHRLWIVAVAGGEPQQIAQDPYGEIHDYSWSPDGQWLAYSLNRPNQQAGLVLYSLKTRQAQPISEPGSNDFSPVFDREGRHLFFLSTRHENPVFSRSEENIATLKMTGIYVATLHHDAASPFAPRSDEGAFNEESKEGKPEEWKPGAGKAVQIDLQGLMGRAVPLPIPAAEIGSLDVRGNEVFYLTLPPPMISGPLPGEKPVLHVFDMKERKDAVVVEGTRSYALSADGRKVLYKLDKDYFIIPAKAGGAKSDEDRKRLNLAHLRVRIEPTAEWAEMFHSAWRLERDFFYSKATNGVDWGAVQDKYAKLLPLIGSRSDLNYLIGEIQGELGNSHTYVGGGDSLPEEKRVPTAFLGADFALDEATGRYRLARIYRGDLTRERYRAPLAAPGLDVHEGDYVLAIDGVELRAPTDPYSLLVGKQDATVRLALSSRADGKPRREIVVQPVANELALRELAWIEHNREVVDKASGGRIAYLYLSDMNALGMEQFIRQFYGQLDKQALLIDERWNGGGFIDQMVLERLRRVLVGMTTGRQQELLPTPPQLIAGPKAVLINHYSASDGDIFPFYFRKYGLGPLIGTRTWGGVRGIRGEWELMDGGYITIPESAVYGLDSQWVIENHGVDPDITVDDTPADWLSGRDVQLEAGVNYLLEELKKHPGGYPPAPAPLPAYPKDGIPGGK